VPLTFPAHHRPISLIITVPAVVAYCTLLRRFGLPGLFRLAPTVARVDLRVYGAMRSGRPRPIVTLWSALIGVSSHQLWDSFTHAGHPVAAGLGLDRFLFDIEIGPLSRAFTVARLLQYTSHSLGSLVALAILFRIAQLRPPGVLDWSDGDRLATEPRPSVAIVAPLLMGVTALGLALWPLVGPRGDTGPGRAR